VADQDPIATQLEAKIARLDAEIAERVAERDRCRTALGALTEDSQSDKLDDMMPTFEKLKRSASAKGTAKTRRLRVACNAKDMSIRDLASRAATSTQYKKITQSHLSRMADGDLFIDRELADWVATQIDYPATSRNWPKLRG
jgi:hypothetical protein